MQNLLRLANAPLVHIARFFPISTNLPVIKSAFKEFQESVFTIMNDMQVNIDKHKKRYKSGCEIMDYVDAYLTEKERLTKLNGNCGTFRYI